jgi:uncharacterized membrane protein
MARNGGRRLGVIAGTVALTAGCIIDLGTLDGATTSALAINDDGYVVGSAVTAGGESTQAVRWLPGEEEPTRLAGDFVRSQAVAVNDDGLAVGSGGEGATVVAVAWEADGTLVDLGLGPATRASDVNDGGTIVGNRWTGDVTSGWVRAPDGTVTELPRAHGANTESQSAAGINDRGDVVGTELRVSGGRVAVLWEAPDLTPVVISTGTSNTSASDVNDAGVVVGGWSGGRPGTGGPLLWEAGTHRQVALPLPDGGFFGSASAVNDAGQVAGTVQRAPVAAAVAVLWEPGAATPTELPDLGGDSSQAFGIAETGEVAGTAATDTGTLHAARWPHR